MSVPEILSILLIGFDLTYELTPESITLVPLPPASKVTVTNSYTLKPSEKVSDWQQIAPGAEMKQTGRRVSVTGLVEDHQAILDLRSGKRKPGEGDLPEALPLSQRLFSLTIRSIPASAVLEELEKSGIQFVWDRRAFEAHQIDLSRHVEMDVKEARADEFFDKLLSPLGVEFDLRGITVTMRPRSGQVQP